MADNAVQISLTKDTEDFYLASDNVGVEPQIPSVRKGGQSVPLVAINIINTNSEVITQPPVGKVRDQNKNPKKYQMTKTAKNQVTVSKRCLAITLSFALVVAISLSITIGYVLGSTRQAATCLQTAKQSPKVRCYASSSYNDLTCDKTVDNKTSTRWTALSVNAGQWIEMTLFAEYRITGLLVRHHCSTIHQCDQIEMKFNSGVSFVINRPCTGTGNHSDCSPPALPMEYYEMPRHLTQQLTDSFRLTCLNMCPYGGFAWSIVEIKWTD